MLNLGANEIKDMLREKGLTQREVADRIGVSPQAVNEIIAGRTTSPTARYAFAAAIDEDVSKIWPVEEVSVR